MTPIPKDYFTGGSCAARIESTGRKGPRPPDIDNCHNRGGAERGDRQDRSSPATAPQIKGATAMSARHVTSNQVSRRSFIKLTGAGTAALGTSAAANAFAQETTGADGTARDSAFPSFFDKPEPITDIAATYDYEIVVVGAGAAGVPAALSACEEGAKVALVQKESTASSTGSMGEAVTSDPETPGFKAYVTEMLRRNDNRSDRTQVEMIARNERAAFEWLIAHAEKFEAPMRIAEVPWAKTMNGYENETIQLNFTKPYANNGAMNDLAAAAEEAGVNAYYDTEAVQLVQDETGAVTGVIASTADGYVQFNASKAVVIATGDYSNNPEMISYYLPMATNFWKKKGWRTGDGHRMMVWAGAVMDANVPSKTIHDFDAGSMVFNQCPLMAVNLDGKRFVDESSVRMETFNNYLTSAEDEGNYCQIFDSNYMEDYADYSPDLEYGVPMPDPEKIKQYMPEEIESESDGMGSFTSLIATYAADTLEELAEKLEIRDVEAFVASVERYNDLCAKGSDDDFGKPASCMHPIVQPPFYGIHRHVGVSCIDHGVLVDGETFQVLNASGEGIPGLYALGNCAGGCYGSPDWCGPSDLTRCWTTGYAVGRALAQM